MSGGLGPTRTATSTTDVDRRNSSPSVGARSCTCVHALLDYDRRESRDRSAVRDRRRARRERAAGRVRRARRRSPPGPRCARGADPTRARPRQAASAPRRRPSHRRPPSSRAAAARRGARTAVARRWRVWAAPPNLIVGARNGRRAAARAPARRGRSARSAQPVRGQGRPRQWLRGARGRGPGRQRRSAGRRRGPPRPFARAVRPTCGVLVTERRSLTGYTGAIVKSIWTSSCCSSAARCSRPPTGRSSRSSSLPRRRSRCCSPCRSSAPPVLVAVAPRRRLSQPAAGQPARDLHDDCRGARGASRVALVAFVAAFGIVLAGGSVLMFLVKGGTVTRCWRPMPRRGRSSASRSR